MTCRQFVEFMMDYLSDELSSTSRRQFEQHLRVCTCCQRYLASYQESVRLGKHAFDDLEAALPAEVPDGLVSAILAARLDLKPTGRTRRRAGSRAF